MKIFNRKKKKEIPKDSAQPTLPKVPKTMPQIINPFEGLFKQQITEVSEKERMAIDVLSKNEYLNKYAQISRSERQNLVKFEIGLEIIANDVIEEFLREDFENPNIAKDLAQNMMGFGFDYPRLWKEQSVSEDREGRKEIVKLFQSTVLEKEVEKKGLKERLLTVG